MLSKTIKCSTLFFIIACSFSSSLFKNKKDLKIEKELWYSSSHHVGEVFENRWDNNEKASPIQFLSWLISKPFKSKKNDTPHVNILSRSNFTENKGFKIWWFGHASVMMQIDTINILFDPVLSDYVGPSEMFSISRIGEIPVDVKELPRIHYVLISHNHYDHLDKQTILSLNKNFSPKFFVPLKVGKLLKSWEIEYIYEFDWYMKTKINSNFEVINLPANHRSNRSINDEKKTLWSSWLVKYKNKKIYFAGDTGFSEHFEEIYGYYGKMDIAMLPIGAYLPRYIMKRSHMSPAEAIKAFELLKSDFILPIHWGAFDQTDETITNPKIVFDSLMTENDKVIDIEIGQSYKIQFN